MSQVLPPGALVQPRRIMRVLVVLSLSIGVTAASFVGLLALLDFPLHSAVFEGLEALSPRARLLVPYIIIGCACAWSIFIIGASRAISRRRSRGWNAATPRAPE